MTKSVAESQLQSGPLTRNEQALGLVAGEGKLPAILAKSAKARGYRVVALAISKDAQYRVSPHADKTHLIAPGQIQRNLRILSEERVNELVFIGKVPKIALLLNILKLDWMAIRELSRLPNFSDDAIQVAAGEFAAKHGLSVRTQSEFLRHLFPDVGVITSRTPTAQEFADIQYGVRIAKEIARLDIGQTVIVREEMILAIEAIEGTDEAIRRAVQLARNPVVVVKVAKAGQDQRFDIPTVGVNTLNSMIAPKPGGVLAIEANETMMVDREEMTAFAEKHHMSIVAV